MAAPGCSASFKHFSTSQNDVWLLVSEPGFSGCWTNIFEHHIEFMFKLQVLMSFDQIRDHNFPDPTGQHIHNSCKHHTGGHGQIIFNTWEHHWVNSTLWGSRLHLDVGVFVSPHNINDVGLLFSHP